MFPLTGSKWWGEVQDVESYGSWNCTSNQFFLNIKIFLIKEVDLWRELTSSPMAV